MIGDVLVFVKDELGAHLAPPPGETAGEPAEELVVFPDGSSTVESPSFKSDAITILLVNVREERILRAPDPYRRPDEEGRPQKVQPELRLNLLLLFVARFKQYPHAWAFLSRVLRYFQHHRVIDTRSAPSLPAGIARLSFELQSLDLAEQNEVWTALRSTHHPSLLYRVGVVPLHDQAVPGAGEVREVEPRLVHLR